MNYTFYTIHGEDSHRIIETTEKPLILGGVQFDAPFCMDANSDGDVILHALTNAVSSATSVNILGKIADDMCKSGITDSKEYLKEALKYLRKSQNIEHISISIEALKPKFAPNIEKMRISISKLMNISSEHVGITATTGEKLTSFGRGEGIFVHAFISWSEEKNNP